MYIPIILGTARTGRQSEKAAKFMLSKVKAYGLETELLDVADYRISATNSNVDTAQAKKLSEIITKADGLIIVSPEYNHGYPGELKMMLDMCYQEYWHKPLGICGVSIGSFGGARMVEQLRLVAIEYHMVPIREAIYFIKIQELFDPKNNILDKSFEPRVKVFLDELSWYAKTLNAGRKKS